MTAAPHWTDAAETRADGPALLVERNWVLARRERVFARLKGLTGAPARALSYEARSLTERLLILESELVKRGML